MPDPLTAEAFQERFAQNYRLEGYGLDVVCHAPCPFCGAADFQQWPILQVERAMEIETKCSDCGRSGRSIIRHIEDGSVHGTFVQTAGDPPPHYMVPPPPFHPELHVG